MFGDTKLAHNKVSGIFLVIVLIHKYEDQSEPKALWLEILSAGQMHSHSRSIQGQWVYLHVIAYISCALSSLYVSKL